MTPSARATGAGAPRSEPTPEERAMGLERYFTDTPGTGGRLKAHPEDFVVEEVPLAFPRPHAEGKYTVAQVRARNWETNTLVRELARRLDIPPHRIFFAGTKDKRAVTTQYLSVRAPLEAVQALDVKDVEILEAFRVDRAPKIGELVGNRFTIRARDFPTTLEDAHAHARATLAALDAAGGFPNYYGPQRFGTLRPITHVVGRRILEGDLRGAVHAYAGNPAPGEEAESREARARFDREGDPAAALEYYPRHLKFERMLLKALADKPGDPGHALRCLPRNLLRMFVHAEQSRVFNRIISERLRRNLPIGEPVEGDFVFGLRPDGTPDRSRAIPVTARNLEKARDQCRRGKALVTGILFGADPTFAEGEPGEIERAIVQEEGLRREMFVPYNLPEAASDGLRREIVSPLGPVNLEAGRDDHGEYLEFRFFLIKGSYATSLLREVMKTPATHLT